MATIYIDPTVAGTGTGTLGDPFQSWASVTWTAGNVYLQKLGTEFSGTIAPSGSGTAGARIVIGAYDQTTGAQVYVGGIRPVVFGTADLDAVNLGRTGSRSYFDIVNMSLAGGTGSSVAGIHGLGATETTARYNNVINCRVTAQNGSGINARGVGWQVINSELVNCQIDGVIIAGSDLLIERCTITGNDVGLVNGDGIQILAAGSCGVSVIRKNYIEQSLSSPKQGIIFQAASGSALIEDNEIHGGGQNAIAMQVPGGIVRRNKIYNATNGISVLVADVLVSANYVSESETGVIFTVSDATGALIYGNTFANISSRGVYNVSAASGATATIKNNAFVSCAGHGVLAQAGADLTYGHNAYFLCGTDNSGGTSLGNNVTTNPLLTSDYKPTQSSPLVAAGTHLGYRRDIEGKQRQNPPCIGAYDAAPMRTPLA